MDPEHFAEWYRRQGHHVIRSHSSYWVDAGPRVYQAFPFGWLVEPSKTELRGLLLKHGIVSLRYSTPLEAPEGKISYHVTLCNPYNLELLRSQARNAVKRGLAKCVVESVPFERVAGEGWSLQRDTLDRQGRIGSMNEAEWRKICLSAVGLDGFESWAAIVDGELAAALIICRINDIFYVPYAFSHRKFLDFYVNNALFYSVSCNLLDRDGISSIFFTVQSLDAPKSVDDFKFRMGFNAKPVRQRVVFNPIIEPFIANPAYRLIDNLLRRYPENGFLAKAEGMIRFYLHGKLPLDKQEWPESVAKFKPTVFEGDQTAVTARSLDKETIQLAEGGSDGKF